MQTPPSNLPTHCHPHSSFLHSFLLTTTLSHSQWRKWWAGWAGEGMLVVTSPRFSSSLAILSVSSLDTHHSIFPLLHHYLQLDLIRCSGFASLTKSLTSLPSSSVSSPQISRRPAVYPCTPQAPARGPSLSVASCRILHNWLSRLAATQGSSQQSAWLSCFSRILYTAANNSKRSLRFMASGLCSQVLRRLYPRLQPN